MEPTENEKNLLMETEELIPYDELVGMVNTFREQLQSLDYRVTNKNFGSKIYQTKETINTKARFVAGADDEVVIMDAQNPVYRLWVGAADPADAPFSVDKLGNLIATSVSLTGYLQVGDALSDIGTGNITSTYIGSNAITTDKIAANAVTATKISVSSLSAINANIGTVTAGTITGVTITGGTVQTSSSGLRTVLGGGDDAIKFMNGATVYGSITPYVFASGNGIQAETITADAYWFIQEGTQNSAGMAIAGGYGIFIETNDITIDGDTTFNDDVVISRTLTVTLGMGGHLDMNGFDITDCDDITCDDINCNVIEADIVQLAGGGYVDDARAFYFETGRTTHVSISGEIRYYDGASKYFEGYVNGFRGSFDLTAT